MLWFPWCNFDRGRAVRRSMAGMSRTTTKDDEDNVRVVRRGRAKAAPEAGLDDFLLRPDPDDKRLTERVRGRDERGAAVETAVVAERPLTLFLNGQEIVTMMTIGDYPEYLAVGYLLNQNMLLADDVITGIDYDDDVEVVVVRTERETDYEDKLKKKIRTSGCAQGTVFGDLMEKFEGIALSRDAVLRTSWLYALSRRINSVPSLYLSAGAIHGCVLCEADRPLVYMEDVGRHNAVDKIAGYMLMNGLTAQDKIFYTTGRLTSEMVLKTVQMEIPILISRSGFTAWGVDLARQAGLTLIGRARGKRFIALSGEERIVYDQESDEAEDEDRRHQRKGSHDDAE
jgi:FdhD protein